MQGELTPPGQIPVFELQLIALVSQQEIVF